MRRWASSVAEKYSDDDDDDDFVISLPWLTTWSCGENADAREMAAKNRIITANPKHVTKCILLCGEY